MLVAGFSYSEMLADAAADKRSGCPCLDLSNQEETRRGKHGVMRVATLTVWQ